MANELAASEPLLPKDLDEIRARLADLDRADSIMGRAERGGIDVSAERAKSSELRAQLLKLRASFFPGQV